MLCCGELSDGSTVPKTQLEVLKETLTENVQSLVGCQRGFYQIDTVIEIEGSRISWQSKRKSRI